MVLEALRVIEGDRVMNTGKKDIKGEVVYMVMRDGWSRGVYADYKDAEDALITERNDFPSSSMCIHSARIR